MAFTPVTIPAGTILDTNASGQGLQDNLDKMKEYVDGGVVAADLATDGWVQPKHLMRGYYNPIVNMHSFVSGLDGSRTASDDEYSFLGNGYTDRGGPSDPSTDAYPDTSINFFLRSPADVMCQFTAYPVTPAMPTLNFNYASRVFIYLDDTQVLGSRCWQTHYPSGVAASLRILPHYQNTWSGFYIAKNLAAGEHTISLRGFTRARYSFLTKWSVSLEAFYR